MPIIKSAKKALRKSKSKRVENIKKNKKIKILLKEVRSLVLKNNAKQAKEKLPQVYKVLDKAAKIGLIKKNTVDRKKSRITRSINKTS